MASDNTDEVHVIDCVCCLGLELSRGLTPVNYTCIFLEVRITTVLKDLKPKGEDWCTLPTMSVITSCFIVNWTTNQELHVLSALEQELQPRDGWVLIYQRESRANTHTRSVVFVGKFGTHAGYIYIIILQNTDVWSWQSYYGETGFTTAVRISGSCGAHVGHMPCHVQNV